jgi:hypothetical protein
MAEKSFSPNYNDARGILKGLWEIVTNEPENKIDQEIDRLINSKFVSIRFCLPTQLLGKLTDSRLNCLCLQKGNADDESQWDPRGFASKVIVPWVAENQSVLGTSNDPYVSKPLRKQYLEQSPGNVKGEDEWVLLYKVLNEVEEKGDPKLTRIKMLESLRSIHKLLSELLFEYTVPERLSLEQTKILVQKFLSESSGGDRGLAIATGLFETFGSFFRLFAEVRRNYINASDQSTGSSGDIECVDEIGNLKISIEVKERNLTLTDVRSAILKARKFSVKELLLNTPGVTENDRRQIDKLITRSWASGTNIYRLTIEDLISVGLFLTGEVGRIDFIKNVGNQLNRYNTQPNNRKRWKELLEEI